MTELLQEFDKQLGGQRNLSIIAETTAVDLPRKIVQRWQEAVENHLADKPLTEAELEKLDASERKVVEQDRLLIYGATALGVLATSRFILYLQLGDGVYMQHGAKQASKESLANVVLGIAGAVLGNGTAANLAKLGMQVGAEGYFLKYSRGDEAQADSTGAIIMYKAGYDPHAMANFFQKLEQQGGASAPQFLSDHPNPGNRVQAVSDEIRNWPPEPYHNDSPQFQSAKNQSNGVKAYSAQDIANGAKSGQWQKQNQQNGAVPKSGPTSSNAPPANGSAPAPSLASVTYDQIKPSSSFTQMQGQGFSISYPQNWQAQPDQNGGGLVAPASAVSNGNIAYGAEIGSAQDPNASSLQQAMQDMVQQMQQSNPGLQISAGPKSIKAAGTKGESLDLTGTSPVVRNGQPDKEHDWLVAVPYGQNAIRYIIFIAPQSDFSKLQPTFKKMLKSFQLQ